MGRLPKSDDFPSPIKLDIIAPPQTDPPTNILILLHGLGDTQSSFTTLARQLSLPSTACLSLRGPVPLLDLGGSHWGDDILFDSSSGGLDPDAGFNASTTLLTSIITDILVAKCSYTPREILLFGFGQGGMAALSVAASLSSIEIGGIISIGAPLASDAPAALDPKCTTPVLVCAGNEQSSVVTGTSEEKLKRVFESVEIRRYRKPADTMPANRGEMMPIMQFFARRLRSTKGVPEGAVEIGAS